MSAVVEAGPGAPLLGPFTRAERATVDEADVIAELIASTRRQGTMVDVGAHQGSSLARFADAGWTVVACEPDDHNRAVLASRFRDSENVRIDARAVSDASAEGIPFYSSPESAGISSLHPFRETHEATQAVDVTTVAELVDLYELTRIDFLKVDVEGLDWKVLKGVPWARIAPAVIECEFEDAKTSSLGYTYRDMADGLAAKGYTVYVSEWHPVVRYGVLHEWRQVARYPTALRAEDAWGNLLAFRVDPGADAVKEAFAACVATRSRSRLRVRRRSAHEPERGSRRPAVTGSSGIESAKYTDHAPVRTPFLQLQRLRARARSYATSRGNHALLVFGRLLLWMGRTARRHVAVLAAALTLVGVLVVLGFVSDLDPWGKLGWLAAGLLALLGVLAVSVGFANHLVDTRVAVMATKLADLSKQHAAGTNAVIARLDDLRTRLADASERDVSLEVVAALRQLRLLWDQRLAGRNGATSAIESEHGHALLMAMLTDEELRSPGVLRGKTLVEIGSTRERDPNQGSTEKLAIFTDFTEMRFVTVDMDPVNTARVGRVIRHLNPRAEAVTARGEEYLARFHQPLDYAYLDAFDFHHHGHSPERQERYRQILDTEINDDECWQMHRSCAESIAARMPEGGVVVIDDTWMTESGDYDGKGKLAVPLLLESGFEILADAPRVVALKRTQPGPDREPVVAADHERQGS